MNLVTINNISIDKFIQKNTYTMTQANEYDEWTDANLKKHRSNYRTRVTGSFDIAFIRSDDHDDILNLLNSNTTEGVTTITAYVQNINDTVEMSGYYTLTSKSYRGFDNGYQRDIMTFTWEEM